MMTTNLTTMTRMTIMLIMLWNDIEVHLVGVVWRGEGNPQEICVVLHPEQQQSRRFLYQHKRNHPQNHYHYHLLPISVKDQSCIILNFMLVGNFILTLKTEFDVITFCS